LFALVFDPYPATSHERSRIVRIIARDGFKPGVTLETIQPYLRTAA
jgi:hypothetical protein